jgi:hypothetical protein
MVASARLSWSLAPYGVDRVDAAKGFKYKMTAAPSHRSSCSCSIAFRARRSRYPVLPYSVHPRSETAASACVDFVS